MKVNTLLVDDDPMLAASVQSLLESWDHNVTVANNGEEALERILDKPFDLVISDIQLPGINGDELMVKARESIPELPYILMTAHGAVKDAVRAIKNGAYQYLLKPIDPDEFEVMVERALESSRLRRENMRLRAEVSGFGPHGERLIGRSPAMQDVHDLITRVARADSTVLITGETGTGKEMVAQTIHYRSLRSKAPLIAFNCAAFNENLMESELFGHERGAFTGAHQTRRGRFEDADGGTIFLDEIGETSKEFQAKMLRVLQEREIERVGGNTRVKVDVRVVASTNRDLQEEVEKGNFREDLFYRLRVVPIHLPPLRERQDDILILADYFLETYRDQYASPVRSISESGLKYLLNQPWKGNVRELKHTLERAVVLASDEELGPDDLRIPDAASRKRKTEGEESVALQDVLDKASREHVLRMLDRTNWRKQAAAELLGVDRATLYRLVKKFQIEQSEKVG